MKLAHQVLLLALALTTATSLVQGSAIMTPPLMPLNGITGGFDAGSYLNLAPLGGPVLIHKSLHKKLVAAILSAFAAKKGMHGPPLPPPPLPLPPLPGKHPLGPWASKHMLVRMACLLATTWT